METQTANPSVRPWGRWPRAILRRVAEAHGMTMAEMEGTGKSMRLARARREAAGALHQEGYSITLICRVLGKNPVTVLEYLNADMRLRRNAERKQMLRMSRARQCEDA